MEHRAQHQGNKPMPAHPKPEDEVQLHIETVIPETEKEELPKSAPEKQETTDHDGPTANEKQPVKNEADDTAENEADISAEQPDHEAQNKSDAHDQKTDDDDDARDQIETVGQ